MLHYTYKALFYITTQVLMRDSEETGIRKETPLAAHTDRSQELCDNLAMCVCARARAWVCSRCGLSHNSTLIMSQDTRSPCVCVCGYFLVAG